MYRIVLILSIFNISQVFGEVIDTNSLCVERNWSIKTQSSTIANLKSINCNLRIVCHTKEKKVFVGAQCSDGKSYYYHGVFHQESYLNSVKFLNDNVSYTKGYIKNGYFYSSQLLEGQFETSNDSKEILKLEFTDRLLFYEKTNEKLAYRKIEKCKNDSFMFLKRCFSSKVFNM